MHPINRRAPVTHVHSLAYLSPNEHHSFKILVCIQRLGSSITQEIIIVCANIMPRFSFMEALGNKKSLRIC